MTTESQQLFVTCASALEPLLEQELHELGIKATHLGFRGVYVESWDWNTIYRINYASRVASRVLLPLTRFRCYDQRSLYRHVLEMNWSPLFRNASSTFCIDPNVYHKELRNSLFAAQIMKDAICDQLREKRGWRPSVDLKNPDIRLNLFIQNQTAVISFDTSGDALHKRGYRQETVDAPIRESLAAALLRLSGYDKEKILFDPCCGSGTILIEAALIATNTPPGYLRKHWGFMQHPAFESLNWLKVRNEIDAHRIPLQPNRIFGIDISKNAVHAAKVNLRASGFSQVITVENADFREHVLLITPDFILTNPPHGRRLDEENQLRPVYRALGELMKTKCLKPGLGAVFTGNLELAKEVGLSAERRHVLDNGGVDSRLLTYNLY